MFRRSLLAVAGLALALGWMGCGPVFRTAMKVERVMQRAELAWMPNRLDYTVYQPSHRVALATLDVLKAELTEVKVHNIELTQDKHFDTPEGKTPKPGDVKIPDDYQGFWMDGLIAGDPPMVVNLRSCDFVGKTRDGQRVDAVVQLEIVGSDQRTVVSVQVGRHGDPKPTKALIDKVSQKIQQPSTRPGSPEEIAALKDAFGRGLKDDLDLIATTGEIKIKKR
jgi:hypothetical protein